MSRTHPVVLLIERDPTLSHQTEWWLRAAGCSVIAADDGECGLRIIEREPGQVDLVVVEAALPGKGGRDFLEVLASQRPGLPVLLTSVAPVPRQLSPSKSPRSEPTLLDPRDTGLLLRPSARSTGTRP